MKRETVEALSAFLDSADPDAPIHAVIDGGNRYRITDAVVVGFGGRSAVALMLRHESNFPTEARPDRLRGDR